MNTRCRGKFDCHKKAVRFFLVKDGSVYGFCDQHAAHLVRGFPKDLGEEAPKELTPEEVKVYLIQED